MANDDLNRVASELLSENFSDILNRAANGDVLAARESLGVFASLLSTQNSNPKTGEPRAIPGYVRDYLAAAFHKMAHENLDPKKALNLVKPGPKKWSHFEKRLCADQVFQLVRQGVPVLEATGDAADSINERLSGHEVPLAWKAMKGSKIDSATLQTWYYELKDELETIYGS